MSKKSTAIDKINKNGVLLVFPKNKRSTKRSLHARMGRPKGGAQEVRHDNQKEPRSLWSELHPRTKMKWEWDDSGDDRVMKLWFLMKELSSSSDVVYSKWYQGRATFFSREVFAAMLALQPPQPRLSEAARNILEVLESDSPLSTRDVKKLTDLQGRYLEPTYNSAMKELFSQLLIVAFGEVDDGAFPSLAVGATANLFEDLYVEAKALKNPLAVIDRCMPEGSLFRKFFDKTLSSPQ